MLVGKYMHAAHVKYCIRTKEKDRNIYFCAFHISGMFSQKVIVIIVLFLGAPPAAGGRTHLVGAGRDAVLQRARARIF